MEGENIMIAMRMARKVQNFGRGVAMGSFSFDLQKSTLTMNNKIEFTVRVNTPKNIKSLTEQICRYEQFCDGSSLCNRMAR